MCLGIVLNNEAGVTCGVAAVTEVFHGISSLLHSGAVGKAQFIFVDETPSASGC